MDWVPESLHCVLEFGMPCVHVWNNKSRQKLNGVQSVLFVIVWKYVANVLAGRAKAKAMKSKKDGEVDGEGATDEK
jgi:hypothetical protein